MQTRAGLILVRPALFQTGYYKREGGQCMALDYKATSQAIRDAGCKTYTPVVITNSDDYVHIKPAAFGPVKPGDRILDIE